MNDEKVVTLAIKFDEASIPISYKIHINNCLTAVRQKMLNAVVQPTAAAKSTAPAAIPNAAAQKAQG